MSFSCTDFTDSVLEHLERVGLLTVQQYDPQDSADQATHAIAAIDALRTRSASCAPSISPPKIATSGMTVQQVCNALCKAVRGIDLEPEWLVAANMFGDEQTAMYGLRADDPRPLEHPDTRFSVSVCRGNSEGFLVHVDAITVDRTGSAPKRTLHQLLRAKVLASRHATALADFVGRSLDVY